jgi:hypothetical protein
MDLNYVALSIPISLSLEEKEKRLADLADTISAIQGGDVVPLGIWAGLLPSDYKSDLMLAL